MAKLAWTIEHGFSLGTSTSPYTAWFEVIGRENQIGYPGDRDDLPDMWIVDRSAPNAPTTPWTTAIAASQLNAIRIESGFSANFGTENADGTTDYDAFPGSQVWHRAPLREQSVPPNLQNDTALSAIPDPGKPADGRYNVDSIIAVIVANYFLTWFLYR